MPIIKKYGFGLGWLLWDKGQQNRTLQCLWGFLRWNTKEMLLVQTEHFLLLLILRMAQVPTGPSTPHAWILFMTVLCQIQKLPSTSDWIWQMFSETLSHAQHFNPAGRCCFPSRTGFAAYAELCAKATSLQSCDCSRDTPQGSHR